MSDNPVRVQLSRKKGWRMPENTIRAARPGRYGNPYRILNEEGWPLVVGPDGTVYSTGDETWPQIEQLAVRLFRENVLPKLDLAPLKGKNLACFCGLCAEHKNGKPFEIVCKECQYCHVDVLGIAANRIVCEPVETDHVG